MFGCPNSDDPNDDISPDHCDPETTTGFHIMSDESDFHLDLYNMVNMTDCTVKFNVKMQDVPTPHAEAKYMDLVCINDTIYMFIQLN